MLDSENEDERPDSGRAKLQKREHDDNSHDSGDEERTPRKAIHAS